MDMQTDPIATAAEAIMGHVNGDHEENLLEYLRAFTDIHDATGALMTGVDREGFDIEATTGTGRVTRRIAWPVTLDRREQVREEMTRMTHDAQARLASDPGSPPPD